MATKLKVKEKESPSIGADFAAEIEQALKLNSTQKISFLDFLTSKDFCHFSLSPTIQAIAEASEGLVPTRIDDALCQSIFKCQKEALTKKKHRVVVVGAGQRGGKTSRLLAPKAVHCAWTVPLPNLMPNEKARAIFMGPELSQARQAFDMAKGIIAGSKVLSDAVVTDLKESVVLRRPDGKLVEICIGAADSEGNAVRSKSLVFLGLDEAALFPGEGFAKDEKEIFRAAVNRIEPGGQLWMISTPWIEGLGLMEELIQENWGTHETALIAARVSTRMLRPEWDKDYEIENADLKRPNGEENVRREIYAIPLTKGTTSFFDHISILTCSNLTAPNKSILERGAGCDFGFDNDFSALLTLSRLAGGHFRIDLAKEWKPSPNATLQPSQVRKEMGELLKGERLNTLWSDSFSAADTKEQFNHIGITVKQSPNTGEEKVAKYNTLREIIHQNRLYYGHLPPAIKDSLTEQLKSILRKPTTQGRYEISAPRKKLTQSGGGGHCDTVSALVEALYAVGARVGQSYEQEEIPAWKKRPPPKNDSDKPKGPWNRQGRQSNNRMPKTPRTL